MILLQVLCLTLADVQILNKLRIVLLFKKKSRDVVFSFEFVQQNSPCYITIMMLFYNKRADVYALYLPKALERTLAMIVNENIFILMI